MPRNVLHWVTDETYIPYDPDKLSLGANPLLFAVERVPALFIFWEPCYTKFVLVGLKGAPTNAKITHLHVHKEKNGGSIV